MAPNLIFLALEIPIDSFDAFLFVIPVGVYLPSTSLRNYINHQKDKITYVPLDLVDDYIYSSLITRPLCWLKNVTSLNLLNEIFPFISADPGFEELTPRVKGMKNCRVADQKI